MQNEACVKGASFDNPQKALEMQELQLKDAHSGEGTWTGVEGIPDEEQPL